ncbi:MAG TPA: hypothetical protein VMW80_14230 [Candidatus Dormibacteraeota bacterium]|nr:hypothetical protein [Candidatus Dormibacteraeota bacterium]
MAVHVSAEPMFGGELFSLRESAREVAAIAEDPFPAGRLALWGGRQGLPGSGEPYELWYVVEGVSYARLSSHDRDLIDQRMNRDKPDRERGSGWHSFLSLSHRQVQGDSGLDEREWPIYGKSGMVGTLRLTFVARDW